MNYTRNQVLCTIAMTLFLVSACNGQSNTSPKDSEKKTINESYQIDPSVRSEVKEFEKESMGSGVVELTMTLNGEKMPLSGMPHPSYAYYIVKSDTFQIMLMPGMMPGYGIAIYVTKDSAKVYHFANPKGPQYVFKSSPADSSYTSGILVKAVSSKVVLAAIPKKGEPIEGLFTYDGDTYYREYDPVDSKIVVNAKGKFVAKYQKMD